MDIKIKKFLICLTYIILLGGCIWMVHSIRKAADMGSPLDSPYTDEGVEQGTFHTQEPVEPETETTKTDAESQEEPDCTGDFVMEEPDRPKEDLKESVKEDAGPVQPETEYELPSIILATDIHHLSPDMKDDGKALNQAVLKDDGKMIHYSDWILEAFLDEVIGKKPTALVLSGDLTVNGEKENHEDLGRRLKRVEEAGIPVLLIPGNHDLNNPNAKVLKGEKSEPTSSVTAEEFYEIYKEYGYDEAFDRDLNSLSYVYQLDEKNRLFMLDTCQYDPVNRVAGRVRAETLVWIQKQLELAAQDGVQVIPIAHHNLLNQSRLFTMECTILNDKEVVELFEEYEIPLYLSGHLHLQRVKKHKKEPGTPEGEFGIQEVITSSLIMPPCQYGLLQWGEDGTLTYQSQTVDVETYAGKQGSTDENLLNFSTYSTSLMKEIIADQTNQKLNDLPEEHTRFMAGIYASIYYDYCRGKAIEEYEVKQTRGYQFWERNLPDHKFVEEMMEMIKDSSGDNFYWEGEFGGK